METLLGRGSMIYPRPKENQVRSILLEGGLVLMHFDAEIESRELRLPLDGREVEAEIVFACFDAGFIALFPRCPSDQQEWTAALDGQQFFQLGQMGVNSRLVALRPDSVPIPLIGMIDGSGYMYARSEIGKIPLGSPVLDGRSGRLVSLVCGVDLDSVRLADFELAPEWLFGELYR